MSYSFPIIVKEKDSGDIYKCNSIADMQYHFEAIDIENMEYEAWDSRAIPLLLKVQKGPTWIKIEPQNSEARPDEVREAILQYAKNVGLDIKEDVGPDNFALVLDKITEELERRKPKSLFQRIFGRK